MANETSKTTTYGILGIVGMFIGLAIFFVILNFFNIISLSNLYPNQFGFLPHKSFPIPNPINYDPIPKNDLSVYCPVAAYPCGGKEIFDGKNFIGIGFKVMEGKEIYAVISGDAIFKDSQTATKSSILDTAIIIGKDKNAGYTAIYDFLGTIPNSEFRQILTGETVGIATRGNYLKGKPDYKGINFVFRLQDDKGNIIKITPSDFNK